jgi:hypothetical protein
MAFEKRTWLARIGTGLNKFIIGDKDANNKQTLTNSPDTVTQQGDVISADNLNDLEDRIDDEFTSHDTRIANNTTAIGNLVTAMADKVDIGDLKIESFSASNLTVYATSQGHYDYINFSIQPSAGYQVIGIAGYSLLMTSSGSALDVSIIGVEAGNTSVRFTYVANEAVPASPTTLASAKVNVLCLKTS